MFGSKYSSLGKVVALVGLLVLSPIIALGQHQEQKEGKETIKVPATLNEIWTKVKEKQQELHNTVASRKLSEAHKIAFAIRDYVAAMPKKSTGLSKEKMTELNKSVKLVASLATFLDEAGDAGDSTKTSGLVVRLDKELAKIEALYPGQTLKSAKSTEVPKSTTANLYVCKMHTEITSYKPGKCSKCGMDLVAKK